jgi:hypothetical protein
MKRMNGLNVFFYEELSIHKDDCVTAYCKL